MKHRHYSSFLFICLLVLILNLFSSCDLLLDKFLNKKALSLSYIPVFTIPDTKSRALTPPSELDSYGKMLLPQLNYFEENPDSDTTMTTRQSLKRDCVKVLTK